MTVQFVEMRFPAERDSVRDYPPDEHWYPAVVIRSEPGTLGDVLSLAVFIDMDARPPRPDGVYVSATTGPVLTCVEVMPFDASNPRAGGWR